MLTETIEQIESGTSLTQDEMAGTIDLIMQGVCAEDDIRAFLLAPRGQRRNRRGNCWSGSGNAQAYDDLGVFPC